MTNEIATKREEEERYLRTKENIISNLYSQKETEKQYLKTVNNLLDYWINELNKVDSQSKERHDKLIELINTERSTVKKIDEDIDRINGMIDQTEKNLEKIRGMVSSLRKEH